MKIIDQLELKNKRVLIRSDLDVPLDESCNITDDARIRGALATIQFAAEKGARVIVAGHLGRPKGKDPLLSMTPVAERLSELLGSPVVFVSDVVGPEVASKVEALQPGQVLLLENVRYYPGEEKNDPEYAKSLASLCDVYVNNAFATAHRAHASTEGITKFVKEKAAGFTLRDELQYFEKSCSNPQRPMIAIFGGAKVSTKLKAIKNVGARADAVIVGGAMANTFFVAQGKSVGKSLFEPEQVEIAKETERWFKENGKTLHLPSDVVVASALESGLATSTVSIDAIPADQMALDIGPKSLADFGKALESAKTIIWNGPMGAFETQEFSNGTYGLIDILIQSPALTVVGGGDTDLALHQRHALDKMDFVSTAGGAFLTLLEGEPLPAVDALK